ncbi:hypothetical protein Ae168Ps1_5306c [Pseudonocardia sp. Ae168_Ps1]|uniref:SH3 domain-containing protein n=1 Tax=unclassified Pseudonocardia TaxID=2619320 RepID=UPI00094B07D1|nr:MULTISPECIES: SH3 domain-containing protein [unclassified Pseudonocardia]OLL76886.1 hypothetical protein Ae150APs1_5264c [Pseudonocardia sp. Ae150A_Ps1]OLL82900.1 hypothetical protein Ae168Ps1_5306c [Pseudonocardia sp. Ae168_Ps1]OLL82988.1 hypothetical protein Ae263Ps1_0043 [Pseudonocardia sp. Ae263_Ps1]OLL90974.1 hypothetical protein Ae356Ps1_0871c [Pseudonocardia sp. Ae356_Ps1]
MADQDVDHLAVAERAARMDDLAVRRGAEGRRAEAEAAADEAARLYRALAADFPAMFGGDADRAGALATALRDAPPGGWSAVLTAAVPHGPVSLGVRAPAAARVPDGPVVPAEPEPAASAGPPPGPRRRRTVTSVVLVTAAVVVVLLGTVGTAGWVLSRPPAQAAVRTEPAPVPVPIRPWTASARADVAPTGVALRPAPSTAGDPVGRLPVGDDVEIRCGEIGRATTTDTGERSSSWLRTATGSWVAAVNVELRGPGTITNCRPGQPPVPVPHHR